MEKDDNVQQNGQNKKCVARSLHEMLYKEDTIVSNHENMNFSTDISNAIIIHVMVVRCRK